MARKRRTPTEDADHRTLVRVLRGAAIFFEHPPLGGYRGRNAGAQMKALGAVAGSPDFRIYDVPPRFPLANGVAFELKRRGGKVSLPTHQERFLVELGARGWVCGWGPLPDAIAWLRWLGYNL